MVSASSGWFYHQTTDTWHGEEEESDGPVMGSGNGQVQTNKCLFIKAGPVCVKSLFIFQNKVAEAGQD